MLNNFAQWQSSPNDHEWLVTVVLERMRLGRGTSVLSFICISERYVTSMPDGRQCMSREDYVSYAEQSVGTVAR